MQGDRWTFAVDYQQIRDVFEFHQVRRALSRGIRGHRRWLAAPRLGERLCRFPRCRPCRHHTIRLRGRNQFVVTWKTFGLVIVDYQRTTRSDRPDWPVSFAACVPGFWCHIYCTVLTSAEALRNRLSTGRPHDVHNWVSVECRWVKFQNGPKGCMWRRGWS